MPTFMARDSLLLCHYKNATTQIQVARISNIDQWYFERVVFPGQDLLFEAPSAAKLEIYGGGVTALLVERLPCRNLKVRQTAD
jgi:hypothetical protein